MTAPKVCVVYERDQVGLPKPRLTVTILPPRSRGALGEVIIQGVPRGRPPADELEYRPKPPQRCGACLSMGHNSRNGKCPARRQP